MQGGCATNVPDIWVYSQAGRTRSVFPSMNREGGCAKYTYSIGRMLHQPGNVGCHPRARTSTTASDSVYRVPERQARETVNGQQLQIESRKIPVPHGKRFRYFVFSREFQSQYMHDKRDFFESSPVNQFPKRARATLYTL